jgi:hypothetical protein
MKKNKTPKFRNAEEKRRYLEAQSNWEKLQQKYKPNPKVKVDKREPLKFDFYVPPGRESQPLPSVNTSGGVAAARESLKYTGDAILGISLVHKSCLQPVFSDEQAKDLAAMRR